jgi:hypothetical protein
MADAWSSFTYTIPDTFPGGLQLLGFQFSVGGGASFAGGVIYVDSITVTGGDPNCGGSGTGTYGWETAGSLQGWAKEGADSDTAVSQSTARSNTGTGSLEVAFVNLVPTSGTAVRRVFLDRPNAYCGQPVTFHLWIPAGFAAAGMSVQPYAVFDNWKGWDYGTTPSLVENGWSLVTYTLPQVGPGGLQRLGLEFSPALTGSAGFTGNVYVDDVSW